MEPIIVALVFTVFAVGIFLFSRSKIRNFFLTKNNFVLSPLFQRLCEKVDFSFVISKI
jgi:hypothetical protein